MGGVATSKDDWPRLAAAVRDRRGELGLTQEQAAAAGGPSTATMRLIEGALQDSYTPATLRKLEGALHWKRGSVRDILSGGSPAPLEQEAPRPPARPAVRAPDPVLGHLLAALAEASRPLALAVLAEAASGRPFADPVERAVWELPDWSPQRKAAEIAILRVAREQFGAGGSAGLETG
jgi:hypothetical protein